MRKLGIGTGLAVAGGVALAVGGFAIGASGDDGGSATVEQMSGGYWPPEIGPPHIRPPRVRPPRLPRAWREERLERRKEFAEDLAAELDKEPEEVEDALRAVFKKRLDQAVEDEWLTRRQADRILRCHEDASCGPLGLPVPPPGLPVPPL
jgi:hypothetical protein